MAIPSLTLRNVKGSALTFSEMDVNLQALANAKVAVTAGGVTSNIALNGDQGLPTALTVANTATIGAWLTGATLNLTSLVAAPSLTAGGNTTAATGFTVQNSGTVQATLVGNVLTLASNIAPGVATTITAGGTATQAAGFTIANASVGASMSGNTITLNMVTAGTPGAYVNVTTDAYGRVTAGSNQLTANLDANGQYVSAAWLTNYREQVANVGPFTGTLTINGNTAPVQTAAVTGAITINTNNITGLQAGKSVTLILYQTGNFALSSNLRFVSGTKTLSTTAGNVDALTIFYDGTTYLAGLARYY